MKLTALLFIDFIGFLFIAPVAFGLYHKGIRFFVVPFVYDKRRCFSMKIEQLSHSHYRLLPLLFHWKSFSADAHIFLVDYSFKSRKQLFKIQ